MEDRSTNCYRVAKTHRRSGSRGDYSVVIAPSVKRRLGLDTFAAIGHAHPSGVALRVPCRLSVQDGLEEDLALVDHSLRFALGIPFDGHEACRIALFPLNLTSRQKVRYRLSGLLGRRYIMLRVCKPLMNDIESDLCRIPVTAFPLLGVEEGDDVVLESVVERDGSFQLRSVKLQAFVASESMIKERESLESPESGARFIQAESVLGVTPDLERVFLDRLDRADLDVEPVHAVRAGRSLGNQFAKNLREFGVIALASLFAIIPFISFGIARALPWVLGALAVAVLLVLWRIRSMMM